MVEFAIELLLMVESLPKFFTDLWIENLFFAFFAL
jgi:hypothetical protein